MFSLTGFASRLDRASARADALVSFVIQNGFALEPEED